MASRARAARADREAAPLRDRALVDRLLKALPFALTGAQRRAWDEVALHWGLAVELGAGRATHAHRREVLVGALLSEVERLLLGGLEAGEEAAGPKPVPKSEITSPGPTAAVTL